MQPIDAYYGSLILLIAFGGLMLIVAIACIALNSAKEDPDLQDLAADVCGSCPQVPELANLDEYHRALARVEELLNQPVPEFSAEYRELSTLAAQVEAYENKHFAWFNS